MALHFNYEKIDQELCVYTNDEGEKCITPRLEIFTYTAMFLDLMSITKKNVNEWLVRMRMYEQAFGPIGKLDGKPWYPTRQDVEQFIGLSTNVATKTRAQFRRQLAKNIEIDAERAVKRADKKFKDEQDGKADA